VVAVHLSNAADIVGAGCLVSGSGVLTCRHVVETALGRGANTGDAVDLTLVGVRGSPRVRGVVERIGTGATLLDDLALVRLLPEHWEQLAVEEAEFATPLRHSGKTFSAFGFPGGDPQGRHAGGRLHASDAFGLVQMDGNTSLLVEQGFSGGPVWSPDLGAFVGLVVAELWDRRVAWCIPSRVLAAFMPELPVRFRIPPVDRPPIHDYNADDPNRQLFGTTASDGWRALSATVTRSGDGYRATFEYRCLPGSPPPLGRFVTFITHDSLTSDTEDAYELFAELRPDGTATQWYDGLEAPFTVAAVADAGETALTFDLVQAPKAPRRFVNAVFED
jgi:hypothetical protein